MTTTFSVSAPGHAVEREFDAIDAAAVGAYVEAHPDLFPLLVDARAALPDFFAPGTRFTLEVVDDPDGGTNAELVGWIFTDVPRPEAWDRLYRFRREWVRQAAVHDTGVLFFTLA